MAILLSEVPASLASDALPHKTWTRSELAVLEETGLLDASHFELIEGELIDKMGKKRPHVRTTKKAAQVLREVFGADRVETEAPIDIAAEDNQMNEPEPDIVVLCPGAEDLDRNPGPAEILLVVEVSDSTLRHDLTTKARLYARAGIPEYWVFDVTARRLNVLREPAVGVYAVRMLLEETDAVSPLANPAQPIRVESMLP